MSKRCLGFCIYPIVRIWVRVDRLNACERLLSWTGVPDLRLSDAPDYVLEIFSRGHCIFKADLIHKKSRPNEAPIKHVLNVVLEDDVKFNLTYKSRRRDFRFKVAL